MSTSKGNKRGSKGNSGTRKSAGRKSSTGKTSRPSKGSSRKKGTGGARRPAPPQGPSPVAVGAVGLVVLLLLGISLFVAFKGPSTQPSPPASPSATPTPTSSAPMERPKRTPKPTPEPEPEPTPEPSQSPETSPEPEPSLEPAAPAVKMGPGGALTGPPAMVEFRGETEKVQVKRVIDGDTFVTTDGRKIRMIGINTPEVGRPFKKDAADALKELIWGAEVTLEYDGPKAKAIGRYKRTLAYVHAKGVFVTGEIVRRGLAYVYLYPDTKSHNEELIGYQREARAAKRYLWSKPLPEPASVYIGNRRAPYFHREGCKRIKRLKRGKNRVEFKSRNEALDSGMNPCDDCKT